ncbi:Uu.00g015750.m01.CDS01 [Anthostomella pinea]|uniref:Nitrogen permease regulator 3 n=1 Tax=Anthostomella pinea TaxID=933095 RepID=A0AAI8VYL4_9PEZI|nr:Uu.00g015750.m01.CDS01 [Anthostomella pinea]
MGSPILPNASNFLGVALVVNRSRDGPRFVFHYPPQILPCNKNASANGPSDGLEDDDDVLLNQTARAPFEAANESLPNSVDLQRWNHDDHLETDSGSQIVPWEHVAGYPTKDLESLLTPARAYHKKLFQVSLDQLCFVSYPIYVPENGIWRKKQPKFQPPKSPETGDLSTKDGQTYISASDVSQIETRDMADDAIPGNPAEEADEKKSGMTMFNLVFILNPKKHEVKELADTLYFHIIKKINKPFRYSQQKSDFVWKESKRILTLKDKNREAKTKMSTLWKEILETSSLAACMQDVYEAVSHNKIAALQLETPEGTITHSVQIPMPFYLTDLPPDDEAGSRGLWITTANYFVDEDSLHDPAFLDKNFALLLMSDEKKIIAELQADPDETTAAMVEFVRLSKPTMSFHQIGQGTALSPAQVREYAQHFIFWRRAIATPPLHARDVYILSPNSDFTLLPQASRAWSRAFPVAPALPDFLAELSVAPRPYKWFCPSKNHRPTYLQMLAWLMRGGWVTQLCTFAYVVVWPEILYEVEYSLEAEELRAAAAAADAPRNGNGEGSEDDAADSDESLEEPVSTMASPSPGEGTQQFDPMTSSNPSLGSPFPAFDPTAAHSPLSASEPAKSLSLSLSLPSPAQGPISPSSASPSASTPTTRTPPTTNERVAEKARLERIADKESRLAAERAAAFARKPVPRQTDHPSLNSAAHLAHLSPYVIVDARRASAAGKDSLYLSAIGRRLRDPAVRAAWPVFWKHFNGRSALERVALLQDVKRKEAWALLGGMSEFLVCVRHW